MERLPQDCVCNQQDTLTNQHATRNIENCLQKNDRRRQTGFFDLPLEIRNMIYGYIFHDAILRISKNGVDIEKSWACCEILQSCRAIIEEATTVLFSTATQLFDDDWQDEAQWQVREKGLNLRPVRPQLVPSIKIAYHGPDNNFRLDMKALKSYKRLTQLELGVFRSMFFEGAPYQVLKDDAKTVNEANENYLVTELKKVLVEKSQFKELLCKPLSLQALRGILHSKNRNFKVLLRCQLELCCFDAQEEHLEHGLGVLLDWDNGKLLENEKN